MEFLKRSLPLVWLLSCVALFPSAGAQELPEVLKDASPQKLMAVGLGLMDLESDRKAEFGKVVDEFSVKTAKAIRKIMKRNEPGMPRKIGKRLKRHQTLVPSWSCTCVCWRWASTPWDCTLRGT